MPTQNVNLPDHQASFIRRKVKSGRYQNASEVVREGLRLLEQREREDELKLERLRLLVREGFDELDRGEVEAIEPGDLKGFIRSVSARNRRKTRR